MPIVSSSLETVMHNSDGTVFAAFLAIDALGIEWRRSRSRFVDEAAAQAALLAFNWTPQLIDRDKQDVLVWVQELNQVGDFDYANRDIDEDDGEDHIFQWFAEAQGDRAITVAWWMDDINTGTFNGIRNRLGYSGEDGANITQRFTFMVAVDPWYEFTVERPE